MNFTESIRKAVNWLTENSTDDYLCVSNVDKRQYPEVTGYTIPTLLNVGYTKYARSWADYLISIQHKDGWWGYHHDNGTIEPYIFDTAQVMDGLSEFRTNHIECKYDTALERAFDWIRSQPNPFDTKHENVPESIHLRSLYCYKKSGFKVDKPIFNSDFDCLSHFYAYKFEGAARLGLDCSDFIELVKKYDGIVPEYPGKTSVCITGLSQIALSLFLCNEYKLGMKVLEYVARWQDDSGGFVGSNGTYFPNEQISWATKFYIDAFLEGQKLWFVENKNIFQDSFEAGDSDPRFMFVKDNVSESDNVLDVGCGKGRYINRLSCNRYACDIADASCFVDAEFQIGSCLRLPHADGSLDVVICAECLEHSVFHENAVTEMLRVLRPGGKLLIIDKDKRYDFKDVHFGEEWIDFEMLKNKFGAEINQLPQDGVAYPFWSAVIKKGFTTVS